MLVALGFQFSNHGKRNDGFECDNAFLRPGGVGNHVRYETKLLDQ